MTGWNLVRLVLFCALPGLVGCEVRPDPIPMDGAAPDQTLPDAGVDQPPAPRGWVFTAGGTGREVACNVAVDGKGNTIVNGYFQGKVAFGGTQLECTDPKGSAGFVIKLDPDGKVLWARALHGAVRQGFTQGDDFCDGMTVDAKGNTLVAGQLEGPLKLDDEVLHTPADTNQHAFVLQLDPSGKKAWVLAAGGGDSWSAAVAKSPTGEIYATGGFSDTITLGQLKPRTARGGWDALVVKLDAKGAPQWLVGDETDGELSAAVWDVAVDGKGDAIITGEYVGTITLGGHKLAIPSGVPRTPLTGRDTFVAKMKSDGSFAWASNAGGTTPGVQIEAQRGVGVDSKGEIYIMAGHGATNTQAVFKIASSGAWASKSLSPKPPHKGCDFAGNLSLTADDTLHACHSFNTSGLVFGNKALLSHAGGLDFWVAAASTKLEWLGAIGGGGAGEDACWDVTADAEGDLRVVGTFEKQATFPRRGDKAGLKATSAGGRDIFVLRYAAAVK